MKFPHKSKTLILLTSILISACIPSEGPQEPLKLESIQSETAKPQIKSGADSTVFRRKKDGSFFGTTQGLRTFVTLNNQKIEVIDATCKIDTEDYQINVRTPARIQLPTLNRNASHALTLSCVSGEKSYKETYYLEFLDAAPGSGVLAKSLAKGLDRYYYKIPGLANTISIDLN